MNDVLRTLANRGPGPSSLEQSVPVSRSVIPVCQSVPSEGSPVGKQWEAKLFSARVQEPDEASTGFVDQQRRRKRVDCIFVPC